MKFLFIIEDGTLDEADFSSSNDLSLIFESIKLGLEVFVVLPGEFLNETGIFYQLVMSSEQLEKLDEIRCDEYFQQMLAMKFSRIHKKNKGFEGNYSLHAVNRSINSNQFVVINRAEPKSLTDDFYNKLLEIESLGVRIFNPAWFNAKYNDKAVIYKLQNDGLIESLKTEICEISSNLPREYMEFHNKNDGKSCIKPFNWYGGTGVVIENSGEEISLQEAKNNIKKLINAVENDGGKVKKVILQEYANFAEEGDLRIVTSFDKIQTIFARFNENGKVHNIHQGGYVKPIFEIEEDPKKAIALHNLTIQIKNLISCEPFNEFLLIGWDAILHQKPNGEFVYFLNEGNSTSPMGQVQGDIQNLLLLHDNGEDFKKIYYQQNFLAKQTIQKLLAILP